MTTKIICSEMPRVAKNTWQHSTHMEYVTGAIMDWQEWLYRTARQNGVPEGIKHTLIKGDSPYDMDVYRFEWWEVVL